MKRSFFSKYKIVVPRAQKNTALSLVIENNLRCICTEIDNNRNLIITVKSKDRPVYEQIFSKRNITAEFYEIRGMSKPLESLGKRHGLLLGFLFLIAFLVYSSKIVWKIEIHAQDGVDEQNVTEQLDAAGFSLGTYIPSIDYDKLHNKVLMNSENLSWISVNIVGNVARVEVKEKIKEQPTKSPTYTNIVAKYDGYIEEITVFNGKKVAKKGDIVKKGEILISGVLDSQAEGIRYEQASGTVVAYVSKPIFIKIPFNNIKKEYTGKKYTDKSYKIYNFPINFLSKYGNQTSFYDTIEKKEKLCFLGISSLPIEVKTTSYYEYVLKEVRLTIPEAVDTAFQELRLELDDKLKNAELIDKEIKTYHDSEAFYIECKLYCLENIAMEQSFFVTK